MKIGIFGGSFDPVHTGHIELARKVVDSGIADRIVFMPAAIQPFKQHRKLATGDDRVNMIELAIEGEEDFEVSRYELERADEVSYTVNTLFAMKEKYGAGNEIALILGADTFLQIHKWTRPRDILENFPIIVGIRPGYRADEIDAQEKYLTEEFGAVIHRVDNPQIDISSTEIRAMVKEDDNDNLDDEFKGHMIPEKVKEYIIEKGLYN